MCTLAIYVRAFPGFPIIVAANRDEFLSRPSSPPTLLDRSAGIFGGRDDVAGGTWLAVNRHGVVAALLNRRTDEPIDPTRHSRGQLCLSMLRSASAAEARRIVESENPERYNPFNLLVADDTQAWIATNHRAQMGVTDLTPGLHLVTNLDLNDPTCPRIAASHRLFAALLDDGAPRPPSPAFIADLRAILSAHETQLDPRIPGSGNSLCLHATEYGTRSSTLLFRNGSTWTYLHANQPPCRSDYHRVDAMEALRSP